MYTDKDRKEDYDYFLSIYNDLYEKYGHKIFVIKNKEILGIYDSLVQAVQETALTYEVGTFIAQECNGDESGYSCYIMSGY